VIVEYFIQNDTLPHKAETVPSNIYILPKKYRQVQDVSLKDIYDSFPNCQNYHLRFENIIMLPNRKASRVWVDFHKSQDVSVPNIDGRIRVKALKMPSGVQIRAPPQMAKSSASYQPMQQRPY
jgi:hypothetical protein